MMALPLAPAGDWQLASCQKVSAPQTCDRCHMRIAAPARNTPFEDATFRENLRSTGVPQILACATETRHATWALVHHMISMYALFQIHPSDCTIG